ncbi:MAG TPA: STAS domain-containing protein [Acidimicrobiia bacterium]|jgi:anti-anti-sigma factor
MHEPVADAAPNPGDVAGLANAGFDYDVAEGSDGAVVSLRGELDLAAAPDLQQQLLGILARQPASLTLDLGGLDFLDSSGLGTLYRARQAAEERGVPLRLDAVPDHVRRVLDVTAMTPLFELNGDQP